MPLPDLDGNPSAFDAAQIGTNAQDRDQRNSVHCYSVPHRHRYTPFQPVPSWLQFAVPTEGNAATEAPRPMQRVRRPSGTRCEPQHRLGALPVSGGGDTGQRLFRLSYRKLGWLADVVARMVDRDWRSDWRARDTCLCVSHTPLNGQGSKMKIDLTQPNPTIDAADLGKLLDIPAAQVITLMREGAITSRFETGIDADAGTHRLTFWYGDLRVRFTCDDNGVVLKSSRNTAKRRQ